MHNNLQANNYLSTRATITLNSEDNIADLTILFANRMYVIDNKKNGDMSPFGVSRMSYIAQISVHQIRVG